VRAGWLLPLLAATVLAAACGSSSTPDGVSSPSSPAPTASPTPTPTATATDGATPTTTPTPSATPTGTPTTSAPQTLVGVFESGFELAAFHPDRRCPGDGPRFWLDWTAESRFAERIREETGRDAFAGAEVRAFRITVRAELSPPGEYGHLGAYTRRVTVHELLDAAPAEGCDAATGGGGEPGGSPPRRVALLGEFELRVGQVVLIGGSDEALRLASVTQDSRCPVDVTCVWAGEALLAFELKRGGATESIAVPVSPAAGAAALGPLRVRVVELAPAPRSTEPIAQARYAATVVLEPLTPPAGESGVQGVVTLGPLCPVQRADQPCPDRPFVATLLLLDADGREVARTTSAEDGAYWLPAPGGRYTLAPQPPDGRPLPRAGDVEVDVRSGHWTTLNVPHDSGIR
jgi:hypothetical protein